MNKELKRILDRIKAKDDISRTSWEKIRFHSICFGSEVTIFLSNNRVAYGYLTTLPGMRDPDWCGLIHTPIDNNDMCDKNNIYDLIREWNTLRDLISNVCVEKIIIG